MSKTNPNVASLGRFYALLLIMLISAFVMVARAVNLQVMETDFLQDQGEARYLREVEIPVARGNITDRNGEPLAVSTPVNSAWVNPQEILENPEGLIKASAILNLEAEEVERALLARTSQDFVWLKRKVNFDESKALAEADITGLYMDKEYQRFYPSGSVATHVVGFTNIDDEGQEGIEILFNPHLKGTPGSKLVIKDRRRRTVEDVQLIRDAVPGGDVVLSLERSLQYLAYKELLAGIKKHKAKSGSVVLMDVSTFEVLAMANWPSYNPNNNQRRGEAIRNRAVTDFVEPGSVIKPLIAAAALESGKFNASTPIDTSPGELVVKQHRVTDTRNYGLIDLTGMITKSSNVGAVKIGRELSSEHMYSVFSRFGLGSVTGSTFPGESAGRLPNFNNWRELEKATMSFGYALTATPLQIAQAYAALANEGRMLPPTFLRNGNSLGNVSAESVIDPEIARQINVMLETVTGPEGTGKKARIMNYRVAGKTGTAKIYGRGGYQIGKYISSFAGFAPASDPKIVAVVVISNPTAGEYYGGAVAAPVFSNVVGAALRLMNIPPDDYQARSLVGTEN